MCCSDAAVLAEFSLPIADITANHGARCNQEQHDERSTARPCTALPLTQFNASLYVFVPTAAVFLLSCTSGNIPQSTQCKRPGVQSISGGLEHPQTPKGPFLETLNFRPSASTEGGCRSKCEGVSVCPRTPPTTSNHQRLHHLRAGSSGISPAGRSM